MNTVAGMKHMERAEERALERLSPFELKDKLIRIAQERAKMASPSQMLNAGRGNPNWIATTPREAFFLLGQFALGESKRVWDDKDLGGMPAKDGIGARFDAYLAKQNGDGARLLTAAVDYGVKTLGFDRDAFVHELADSIIGDNYPVPDRMLKHAEAVAHAYLAQEMCGNKPPAGRFDLFAVEGGTAAMCYIFDSLQINRLLKRGDKIAIGAPIFTPYIEMPQLDQYGLKIVRIDAGELRDDGTHNWQYPDSEIDKLADPSIKAFFLVNPSNPPSVAVRLSTIARIIGIVKTKNPNLIIITDDVYGTFVEGFRSLMADLPQNTIGVYSYSKYFGATGWRLGVVAVHQDNIFDKMIAALPEADRRALNKRYGSLTLEPEKMKFIDRMVADSRRVALNHTAGLSLPQQVQMTLFSLFALTDRNNAYKRLTRDIVRKRIEKFWEGFHKTPPLDPLRANYYSTVDILIGADQAIGKEFCDYMQASYEPIDVLVRLAEQYGTVLLNGSGFDGPLWSVRCSLANLPDEAYAKIGGELEAVVRQYAEEWQKAKR
ncbi:MAG TPA: bifunctional aspartate transaminase/aspartate 4-decarboxylase [Pseudolabrys sp.]|nr:bifunctional aspartate transaminase/aspartate 4-decarboxylase [Pseudolabrys sp.]